jgi:hypothetical protein
LDIHRADINARTVFCGEQVNEFAFHRND